MKANGFRNLIIVTMIGLGAFVYFDPLKPSVPEIQGAIREALSAPESSEFETAEAGRSFMGRRLGDAISYRVWPVHVKVSAGAKQYPEQNFFVWKEQDGAWKAEADNLLGGQWVNTGYFGVGKFGF